MKRINTILACILALTAVSCEKFFDRTPENKFAANTFFASENDLILYTNGLINTAMPSATSIALGEDRFTDLCGTKASKTDNFYQEGYYNAGVAGGWSYSNWGFLRQVAYMLENMGNAKGTMSDEKYNHYEGVARFWRAYSTFNKVKDFGDCYFIDHVISSEDELLYEPRQSREYVMHMILEDLKFACKHCLTSGANVNTDGRVYINRYVALAIASRICLYEGTYRKYHSANTSTGKAWSTEYESSEDFLTYAYEFSKELMDMNKFKLASDYRSLFTSLTLNTDEVIWGRTCNEELGAKHDVTFKYCSATSSLLYSPTKDYVGMFLKADGNPAPRNISVTKEFEGRDRRLAACILGPGMKMLNAAGKEVDFAPDFTWTKSGYVFIKWVMAQSNDMSNANSVSLNSLPIVRYAEVLLNHAEAAAELGKMDKATWDATIGKLRERAGVRNIYPEEGSYVKDIVLEDYWTRDLAHPVALNNVMVEIRRERATELMMEMDSHYDDLMRWAWGDLISRRYDGSSWRGIYVTEKEAQSGWTMNGKTYSVSTIKNNSSTNYKITSAVSQGMTLSEGTYGYVQYHYDVWWHDKMYLKPIPTTALNVNPDLGQNNGWQWM